MPFVIIISPNVTTPQGKIIPDATETTDGVMTAAMVRKLNSLTPGGGGAIVYATSAELLAATPPAPTDPQIPAIAANVDGSGEAGLYWSFNGGWCFITILSVI